MCSAGDRQSRRRSVSLAIVPAKYEGVDTTLTLCKILALSTARVPTLPPKEALILELLVQESELYRFAAGGGVKRRLKRGTRLRRDLGRYGRQSFISSRSKPHQPTRAACPAAVPADCLGRRVLRAYTHVIRRTNGRSWRMTRSAATSRARQAPIRRQHPGAADRTGNCGFRSVSASRRWRTAVGGDGGGSRLRATWPFGRWRSSRCRRRARRPRPLNPASADRPAVGRTVLFSAIVIGGHRAFLRRITADPRNMQASRALLFVYLVPAGVDRFHCRWGCLRRLLGLRGCNVTRPIAVP